MPIELNLEVKKLKNAYNDFFSIKVFKASICCAGEFLAKEVLKSLVHCPVFKLTNMGVIKFLFCGYSAETHEPKISILFTGNNHVTHAVFLRSGRAVTGSIRKN